ncbi:MAG: nicotinate-nucleotide diphosphorylase (carboxylating) [Alteromonadaceae bacterium]|nr:MAG: nicotinate-nucleotide diphosphorylase (carboxylating) [Alteromonadaceae bacterium]
MNISLENAKNDIARSVKLALEEDVGSGDITAMLIPKSKTDCAQIITREACIVCGQPWANETFQQLGLENPVTWYVAEGESVEANTKLAELRGNTRILLTGERTALNFLQLLSGIATKAQRYRQSVSNRDIQVLDTRKTLPGLRIAQKYAVAVGGCDNHRIGLFDAFLIKENHISACGSIEQAINAARELAPDKPIEVEVEDIEQLLEAERCQADIIMLDNFSEQALEQLADITIKHARIELSGNIILGGNTNGGEEPKNQYANIDRISSGDLTKNCTAIDLSMRLIEG